MVCICLYVNISHQINANHRPREEYGVWGGEMGLRKGIQWETARIGRHLRDSMRTQFSDFLKYMKAILKKFPNDEGKGVPTSHVLTPNEASSSENGLCPIRLLAKRLPWEFSNNPVSYSPHLIIGCSPQNDSKIPLLKTTPMVLIEDGDADPSPLIF